jgi:HAD superfamily hydrolase (TIGR01509 family)
MQGRSFRAAIFDMDGLMLDTESVEREAFLKAAAEFGYSVPDEVYIQVVGRTGEDARQIFCDAFGGCFPYDDVRVRWREYTDHHIAACGVPCKAGLLELLELMETYGIPKAVATSTRRQRALRLLEKSNLLSRFDAIVAGDEVSRGKPDPEIFLIAAMKLNVPPHQCIAFEDSAAGILAAHAAGMIPILVPDLVKPAASVCDLAHRVYESLSDARDLFRRSG